MFALRIETLLPVYLVNKKGVNMAEQFLYTFLIIYALMIVHAVEVGNFEYDKYVYNTMGFVKLGAAISAIWTVWS
jgi:hypothetical protein